MLFLLVIKGWVFDRSNAMFALVGFFEFSAGDNAHNASLFLIRISKKRVRQDIFEIYKRWWWLMPEKSTLFVQNLDTARHK